MRPTSRFRRRLGLGLAALAAAGALSFFTWIPASVERRLNAVSSERAGRVGARAAELHRSLLVADLHADTLLWDRDLLARGRRGHADVPRLLAGNVALQVFSGVTYDPLPLALLPAPWRPDRVAPLIVAELWPPRTWTSLLARALHEAGTFDDAVARSGGRLRRVRSKRDLAELLASRAGTAPTPLGGLLSIEGLQCLEGRLDNVDVLYRAGFRMMGLAHFTDNEVAGSTHGAGRHGLTPLGREVVRRMESLGVAVDVAHASPATIDDVLAIATRPVVASHTGVVATCPGPRNLTDDQLRGIAASGGVIGIAYFEVAVCGIEPRSIADAIRHAVAVAGIDHVGLGSDFDGAVRTSFDAAGLAQVTQALLDAGFTDEEIRKIEGENALRVLSETLPEGTGL